MSTTFNVTFDLDNAAFGDDGLATAGDEVARILRVVADRVEQGTWDASVRDINGNIVGWFKAEDVQS